MYLLSLLIVRITNHDKALCCSVKPATRKGTAFLEQFQASPLCPSDRISVMMKMSMERWWNDTDRGKLKYWERNIIQRVW
jgi:hypothetical protein